MDDEWPGTPQFPFDDCDLDAELGWYRKTGVLPGSAILDDSTRYITPPDEGHLARVLPFRRKDA